MAEGLGKLSWPSAKVRETFIQYFVRNSKLPHVFVPSSSIIPKNDPSIAFTNAGMNQFKDVILGNGKPKYPRAVNSQKCLRINDLHLVGTDTYHQTFFEMLGNWSFSNYFKKESCAMAWDLLTNVYKLDPSRLYVTYFSGWDSVPTDHETKEIWESIGVPQSRILPYDKENFWTMGPVGPCGPSTEIHYDHRGVTCDPSLVNRDSGHVVELWNLVFMQYNRNEAGKLERLPLTHVVDTGAGLERLTAVLNQKVSNYETDLFFPVFSKIHKLTGVPQYSSSFESELDLCYRVFADHMRATTVALSDGVLPQTNQKIRRLIQRSLSITQTQFIPKVKSSVDIVDFLKETVDTVAKTLSEAFPEVEEMKAETVSILAFEVVRYLDFLKSHATSKEKNLTIPPLVAADFPQLLKIPKDEIEGVKSIGRIEGKTAFNWYERHGVSDEALEELAMSLGLQFAPEDLKAELDKVKRIFRDDVAKQIMANEENHFARKVESLLDLYSPKFSGGVYVSSAQISHDNPIIIEWVFDEEGNPVEEICKENNSYWIILNRSPFMPGNDLLESDAGIIFLENKIKLNVSSVKKLPSGWILHRVNDVPEVGFSRKSSVSEIHVDNEKKYGREMSKNSLYYLKIWLKRKFGVVRFGTESVHDKEIKLVVTILHGDFNLREIEESQQFLNEYAAPIVVTKRIHKKNGEFEIVCATGLAAEVAMRSGWEISKAVSELILLMKKCERDYSSFKTEVENLVEEIRFCAIDGNIPLSHEVNIMVEEAILGAEKLLAKQETSIEVNNMVSEISEVKDPFVVKAFASDVEFTSLKKITRAASNKPILVLVHSSDGFIQGRCCIPKELVTEQFSAEKWMNCFVTEFGRGSIGAPKGQDPNLVALLKRFRFQRAELNLSTALEKAREYAKQAIAVAATSSTPPLSSSELGLK